MLRCLETGEIQVVGCDLTEPSPLALEALSARPYAFLDDAPLEERRTQAVMARRWRDPQSASDLGRLDPEAIAKVQEEAWPDPVNAEELHDALLWLGCLTEAEARATPGWSEWLDALARDKRVALLKASQHARCGFQPSGSLNSVPFGPRRGSSRRSRRPPNRPAKHGRRIKPWSRSCAVGSRVSGR